MIDLLNNPAVFATIAAVLGLFVGSFLNVVVHRLPRMLEREWALQAADIRGEEAPEVEHINLATPRSRCPHCGHMIGALENIPLLSINLATPRSRCPHCGHMIGALENIPLLSFLFLRGRCSHCQAPISGRYPVVEALSGVLSAYAAWHFGFTPAAAGALIFIWSMIALAFIDLDTHLLPDNITLPLLWAGLIFNVVHTYTDLASAVIGAAAGYLVLWSVFWLFKLVTGKEGMGYGDFKLLAAIGAWLGWQHLPLTLLFSSLVGAIVGIALVAFARHNRSTPIPFGPYLATAGLIALFWGDVIASAYRASIGL